VEGKGDGHWVLLDYGEVIFHIFYETTRVFYDLEGLWSDATRITTESMQKSHTADARVFDGQEIIVE
jgi:ribosome-associated protein